MLSIKNKIKSDWLKAMGITGCMLIIFVFVFNPQFETSDDNAMAAISTGMRGDYNSHLIFINIIIGKIINIFMRMLPMVKWYVVFQYLCLYVAFTVILYSVIKLFKNNANIAYLIIGILILIWGYDSFVIVQFSRTAGICGAAGSILIFANMKEEKKKWFEVILGGTLLCLCGMIRFQVMGLVMLFSVVMGLAVLRTKLKSKNLKDIYLCIVVFAFTFVLGVGLYALDSQIYDSQDGWKEYREYNHLRAELLDRGFPSYAENVENYEELGITENDILNWSSWNFADKEAFTIETMKSIIELKEHKEFSVAFLGEFFEKFFIVFLDTFWQERSFLGLILLFSLWLLYYRKNVLETVLLFVTVIGVNLYFYWNNRYLMARIDMVIWLMAGISLIYFISEKQEHIKASGKSVFFFLLGMSVLSSGVFQTNLKIDVNSEEKINAKEYLNMISEDGDKVYFVSVGSSPENLAYGIFDLPRKGLLDNYYSLGGWQTNSPITNAVLLRYSIENPYRDIVNNPDIYLVDNGNIDIKVTYIKEHYAEDAYAVLVKDIFGNKIYKIITVAPILDMNQVIQNDLKIKSSFDCQVRDGIIFVKGFAYKEDENSWREEFYTVVSNKESGEEKCYFSTQKEKEGITEPCSERYAGFETMINVGDISKGNYVIKQVLKIDDKMYEVGSSELEIQ